MKLRLCSHCSDGRTLAPGAWTVCRCGASRGRYTDDLHAVLEGRHALALGVHNASLEDALRRAWREREAEIARDLGRAFTAFVIPWNARTVGRSRECPCGTDRVAAFPGRPMQTCACSRYALRIDAQPLEAAFVPADTNPSRRQPRRERRGPSA